MEKKYLLGLKIWTSWGVSQLFSKSHYYDDFLLFYSKLHVFIKLKGISYINLREEKRRKEKRKKKQKTKNIKKKPTKKRKDKIL